MSLVEFTRVIRAIDRQEKVCIDFSLHQGLSRLHTAFNFSWMELTTFLVKVSEAEAPFPSGPKQDEF